ncbi:MAG TPA: tol-pal system protein YbgF [Rhizomicrobium sp.]|nr:tol-pal system protein YbgF [Rhizomicrobium sp.]
MRKMSCAAAVAAGIFLMAANATSAPQPDDSTPLRARLDADLAQDRALESRVAADSQKLGGVQVAALFGESDEEKAAREQHEQNQDSGIASLNQKAQDLENSLRNLTGQVEQLDHRITEMNQRMDRMQKDFDYKLCTMAAQQLGASAAPGDTPALPCNSTAASAPAPQSFSPQSAPASGPPAHLAPGPSVIGTIPAGTPLPPPPSSSPVEATVSSARPEFDMAMNLLAKALYDQARAAFRSFADNHPKDDLAPQALYWVGDIDYVQKDYPNAARAFVEGVKKYPASPRAADSMLKLGQSLIAMDQKKEGCAALAALPSKYPAASKKITDQAASVRKSAACR